MLNSRLKILCFLGGSSEAIFYDVGEFFCADVGDVWYQNRSKSMPNRSQERKREHAVFDAPAESKCMF